MKVFLPGITDTSTLDSASKLCGQAAWKIRGHYHQTWHEIATADMIRQLPAGHALVIRGGYAPVIARLPKAWRNRLYRRARRVAAPQTTAIAPGQADPAVLLPPLRSLRPIIADHVPDDLAGDGPGDIPWS